MGTPFRKTLSDSSGLAQHQLLQPKLAFLKDKMDDRDGWVGLAVEDVPDDFGTSQLHKIFGSAAAVRTLSRAFVPFHHIFTLRGTARPV